MRIGGGDGRWRWRSRWSNWRRRCWPHSHAQIQRRWLLLLLPLFSLGWLASLPAFFHRRRRRGIDVFLNKPSQQSVGRWIRTRAVWTFELAKNTRVESRKIYTEFPGETKGIAGNAYIFGYIATKIYAIPFVNKKKETKQNQKTQKRKQKPKRSERRSEKKDIILNLWCRCSVVVLEDGISWHAPCRRGVTRHSLAASAPI